MKDEKEQRGKKRAKSGVKREEGEGKRGDGGVRLTMKRRREGRIRSR